MKKWREEDKEMQANEERVEQRIRMMRKDKNKDRIQHQRKQPSANRTRLDSDADRTSDRYKYEA